MALIMVKLLRLHADVSELKISDWADSGGLLALHRDVGRVCGSGMRTYTGMHW